MTGVTKKKTEWKVVCLSDICEFKYGKSLPDKVRIPGLNPVYGSNGIVGTHDQAITCGPTIVIGRKGSFGEVNFSHVSCWPIDTTFYIDSSATNEDLRWLSHTLQMLGFSKMNHAAAVPGLSRVDAYRKTLLLPPLEEQRRIADILDRAAALRRLRKETLARLDELTRSIFLDMFGDPATNPKGWKKHRLENLAELKLGKMLDQKKQTGESSRYYLRNANVQWFHFDLTDVFQMDFNDNSRKQFSLKKGDLLVCEGGEPGRAAIWLEQIPECYYQKALHRIRPNVETNSQYLAWVFWFFSQSGVLTDRINAATIAHLTAEKLKLLLVPLPPLPLQQEFARRVEAVEHLKDRQRAHLATLDELFASLQHRAFRGEL